MKITFNCTECGKEYHRYYRNNGGGVPKTPFCSNSCKGKWQSKNLRAENNPNYGNTWSDSQKAALSEKTKQSMTPERRAEIGSQHRGKILSAETIEKMHGHRTKESYSRPHTECSKKKIGEKSSAKFKDDEYLKKLRESMETRGYWVPLSEKDGYDVYKGVADWVAKMVDNMSEEDVNRLNTIGMFNIKTNRKGLVRDHKYSRVDGFTARVFPEILRHPCNCALITHSENSGKRSKSSLLLDELFDSIRAFTGEWCEHSKVLDLISRYENGERWDLQQYIKDIYE